MRIQSSTPRCSSLSPDRVAYCVEAAVDILIPMALFWQLRKVKSTFQSTRRFVVAVCTTSSRLLHSSSLLRQLSIQAFTSGCIVALVGIAFIALFWMGRSGKRFLAPMNNANIEATFFRIPCNIHLLWTPLHYHRPHEPTETKRRGH